MRLRRMQVILSKILPESICPGSQIGKDGGLRGHGKRETFEGSSPSLGTKVFVSSPADQRFKMYTGCAVYNKSAPDNVISGTTGCSSVG